MELPDGQKSFKIRLVV